MHLLDRRETSHESAPANDERPQRRALALFNPRARLVAKNLDRVLAALRSHGLDILERSAPSRTAVPDVVRSHAGDVDLVIAIGGDGTLNAILQGLIETRLPLGVIPLGTANDLCKTLGIPLGLDAACETIASGHKRRIDVGRVNGVYYFLEASIGLSVTLCRRLDGVSKGRFGVLAHLVTAFAIMRRMRRFRALVSADDAPERALHAAQLTLGNSKHFGGLLASDEASIDDRLLDMYSVEFRHWWTYFEALYSLLRRRYDDADTVLTMHARRFRVRTGKPMPIEADGEIVTHTPALFESVGGAVDVLVPDTG